MGDALMRACLNETEASGAPAVWLSVWERNHRAQAFYRRWGFRVAGTHAFALGSDVQTDFLMERSLPTQPANANVSRL